MTPKEVLIKARELIADESRWVTATLAATGPNPYTDPPVAPNEPDARCWCALGAISAAVNFGGYPQDDGPEAQEAVRLLADAIVERFPDKFGEPASTKHLAAYAPETVVFRLNDTPTGGHACVLEAYDAAIAACND